MARLKHLRMDLLGAAKRFARKLSPGLQSRIRAIHRYVIRRTLRRRPYVVNRIGIRLYVEPSDPRAEMLAITGGRKARAVIELWSRLVQELRPDVAIDVGANYGEVVLSTGYPVQTRVVAMEANPAVATLLSQSIAESGLSIELVRGAASDRSGTVDLYVSDRSSGLSSLDREVGAPVTVPAMRLDDILGASQGNLVAKIDVEGHELNVLAGMSRVLGACRNYALIVEWSKSDDDAVNQLHSRHRVALVRKTDLAEVPSSPTAMRSYMLERSRSEYLKDILLRPMRSRNP